MSAVRAWEEVDSGSCEEPLRGERAGSHTRGSQWGGGDYPHECLRPILWEVLRRGTL